MSKYLNPDQTWIRGKRYRKGKGGSEGGFQTNQQVADLANQGTFKPYTLTTSAGTGFGNADGTFGANSSDPYAQASQSAMGGANQLIPQISDAFGRPADQFSFDSSLGDRTNSIFAEQSALLQPQFDQQRMALQNDLFGSGRMGLSLAGQAAGAGNTGMVNPDAFGLGQAQSQTLANLGAQSRQQALGEQQQQYGIDSGVFGMNQGLEQQRAQNLMAGSQGLFGLGNAVTEQELKLIQAGLANEQARGASYANAANSVAAGSNYQQGSEGGKGILGTVAGAVGSSFGGPVGGFLANKAVGAFDSGNSFASNNPSYTNVMGG